MEKKWITVKETVERFVVKEATVRYAINNKKVQGSREKRDGREVAVILEDDAVNRWARRSDELIDAYFADLVERFDEKFPRGDQTGLSAKQQFESNVYGKVGLPDGKPRSLSLQNIFENAIGGTIASVGVFAGVKFLEFLQKSVDAGDSSPEPRRFENAVISNSIGMQFVRIPRGAFLMGSPLGEEGRHNNELQHAVRLNRDFYFGVHTVTQRQYVKVIGKNPSWFQGPKVMNVDSSNHPVDSVSHLDAEEFCRRLSELPEEQIAGRQYRLPTEAEWEYACRAGSKTAFSFGNDVADLGRHAWYKANSGDLTHAVGSKKPNAFGLYDMHGNVEEWCSDWYGEYPSTSLTDPRGPDPRLPDPWEPDSVFYTRVLRGGSWRFEPLCVRCAARGSGFPEDFSWTYGFRLVLE